jgi:hypothetical protein
MRLHLRTNLDSILNLSNEEIVAERRKIHNETKEDYSKEGIKIREEEMLIQTLNMEVLLCIRR